jgi:hypothetical protein
VDLIVKDAAPLVRDAAAFITRARQFRPASVILCLLPVDTASPEAESALDAADFVLLQPFTARHLQGVLRHADEKLRLLQEVAALRASRLMAAVPAGAIAGPTAPPAAAHTLTQVVRELAKALAAGFDLPRVLDLFLDAVSELVRPSRSALLLADPESRQIGCAPSGGSPPIWSSRSCSAPRRGCPSGSPLKAA